MSIRRLKALLWTLGVFALMGGGYTFFDIYEGKKSGRYDARDQQYSNDLIRRDLDQVEDTGRSGGYYPKDEYEKVWSSRIDGSWPKEVDTTARDAQLAAQQAKQRTPPIADVLEISAIIWSPDPIDRFIALSYKNESGAGGKVRQTHLSEGSVLRAPYDEAPYLGRIIEISEQTVRFQWGDGEEVVTPGLGRDGNAPPLKDFVIGQVEDPTADYDEAPEETVELEPGRFLVGTKDIAEMREKGPALLREDVVVRTITPKGTDGRSSIELNKVDPDSIAARYGFASGDRIISVNGFPMQSEAAAMNWYKQNDGLPTYVVVYERKGAEKTTTIHNKNS